MVCRKDASLKTPKIPPKKPNLTFYGFFRLLRFTIPKSPDFSHLHQSIRGFFREGGKIPYNRQSENRYEKISSVWIWRIGLENHDKQLKNLRERKPGDPDSMASLLLDGNQGPSGKKSAQSLFSTSSWEIRHA
ncbi:unnamed protein product [Cuscuta campestris]|uniref:Uncharacterized protein n=1 Tax=Cuscuta campestris TaxID=132261 RepID=A0A484KH67_9ASTE|nr:unnamed protein product [Cuscuta campestris]